MAVVVREVVEEIMLNIQPNKTTLLLKVVVGIFCCKIYSSFTFVFDDTYTQEINFKVVTCLFFHYVKTFRLPWWCVADAKYSSGMRPTLSL